MPEDWRWFGAHRPAQLTATPRYRATVARVLLGSLLRIVLVIVSVVLAMPAITWLSIATRLSLYQLAPLTLAVLVTGSVLIVVILAKWVRSMRNARAEALREELGGRVFGSPGMVLAAVEKYGRGRVEAGARGEMSTALLLELLLRIPGVTVYHGLQFPGNDDADVDHAVVFRNIVYLLDSKLYRWGQYEWSISGEKDLIVRSDGYGRGTANWMHVAAHGYQRLLGPQVEVVPMVLIHGRKVSVGRRSLSSRGVHMLTAGEAMERIGNTIHGALEIGKDNPAVRDALAGKLKAA
ncbi:NERD domain-containing protein [Pseudarthrobacter scleromae]|uniref:NERD domain-containing protein n=1 Tax=Pseudarthrobacter scleromae TaxID=158897 RepID=UPI00363A820C